MVSNTRAAGMVEQLRTAVDAFIALINQIPADRWSRVDGPDVWSPSKDAEHVAEGNALHQWVVLSALHLKPGQRPVVERTTPRSSANFAAREPIELTRSRPRALDF